MSKVALVVDSTTHLPAEIMRPYRIWQVPIMLIWGPKSCADGVGYSGRRVLHPATPQQQVTGDIATISAGLP